MVRLLRLIWTGQAGPAAACDRVKALMARECIAGTDRRATVMQPLLQRRRAPPMSYRSPGSPIAGSNIGERMPR
jgi:hypothetical protein